MYLQLKSTVLEDEKSLGSLYHVDDDNLKALYEILIIFLVCTSSICFVFLITYATF